MPIYDVKVLVEYNYEVEANSAEEAEQEGWKYEDYSHFADVYSIEIEEIDEEDEDEDESDD